jgi:hypothetical protein
MMSLAAKVKEFAEEGGLDFRGSYSGRCMYGKTCVGVVAGDLSSFLSFFAFLVRCLDDDNDIEKIANVRQDSMGRQTIYYWPSIESEEFEEDEGVMLESNVLENEE